MVTRFEDEAEHWLAYVVYFKLT